MGTAYSALRAEVCGNTASTAAVSVMGEAAVDAASALRKTRRVLVNYMTKLECLCKAELERPGGCLLRRNVCGLLVMMIGYLFKSKLNVLYIWAFRRSLTS